MRKRLVTGMIILSAVVIFFPFLIHAKEKDQKTEMFHQVELFSDALAVIQSEYVDEVSFKNLIYGALKGMVSTLDPHSQFMDPDTFNELKVDTDGFFGGLGIEIAIKDGLLTVIAPLEDSPAWKAGVKAGDRIVKIGGEVTRDITMSEAVKKLRGRPGEPVAITVLRESEKKIINFNIVRDVIKVAAVKEGRILEDGIGYIRIVEFRGDAASELEQKLEALKKESMSALILDLRNDPGGLLDAAVKVAGKFLNKGDLIVYTKGRKNKESLKFLANSPYPMTDIPMAVLINEGSASASEIVAGAFQDHKRAVIVGVKSFGKGSVQTVIPLSDGSGLKLTTSKYFTPLGKVIHEKGVIPDIIVEEAQPPEVKADADSAMKKDEAFQQVENKTEEKIGAIENKDYKKDNQLMRAVDILRALRIYQSKNK